MSDIAADTSLTPPQAATAPVTTVPPWKIMVTLLRREFWEHRALWMVPLICGAMMIVTAMLINPTRNGPSPFPFGGTPPGMAGGDPHILGVMLASARQFGVEAALFLPSAVMLFFYLLSSLYDERKDRSILFWKSLPVSDSATVLSKVLVAMVIVPLGVFAVAIVTDLLYAWVWDLRRTLGFAGGAKFVWDMVAWAKVEGLMLSMLGVAALWYAPIAGYLLLVSAWARRNAFLWAVMPPWILAVVERIAFGTEYVRSLLLSRLGGVWYHIGTNVAASAKAAGFAGGGGDPAHVKIGPLPSLFEWVNFPALLTDPDLWIGLLFAVALIYASVRLRRYRDDT
jgi:ABC-2 type transport system permease protein